MSYVDVVVDRPGQDIFSYRLTPETFLNSRPGTLVEISLGNRKLPGVIWRLRKTVKAEIRGKLRPLNRILSEGVWVPNISRLIALALAEYSGESIGVCLFRLLPSIAKRKFLALRPSFPHTQIGKRFHCYGIRQERYRQYQMLIEKSLCANRQTLLIAPREQHPALFSQLMSLAPQIEAVTGDLTPTKQRQIATAFSAGLLPILIGTRHIVGWPAYSLGLIIVEDAYHQGHTDDQRPYLDSATIAYVRALSQGANCLLGASLPTPALILAEQNAIASRIQSRTPALLASVNYLHAQGGLALSNQVWEIIEIMARENKLVLIITPRGEEDKSSFSVKALRKRLFERLPKAKNFTVATEKILDSGQNFQSIIFVAADSPLLSPELDRPWRYLMKIQEARALTNQVYIETSHPELIYWQIFGRDQTTIWQTLLTERRQLNLPPFTRKLTFFDPVKNISKTHHLPEKDFLSAREKLKNQLPRSVQIKTDSILDHAFQPAIPTRALLK
ncbi:hypothetical protein HYW32_04335 [Candidatus Berkelbacteria bacterium]|nr:hypothetical protein [Candidatus Berkelbacteria bacterium]